MQTDIPIIKRPVLRLIRSVLNTLNKIFTFDEDHRHIDDEKFQVSIDVSKKRITNILLVLSILMTLSASMQIIIISQTFKRPNYNEISKVEGEDRYF